ncbi:MAG: hypothetical protein HDR92_08265 [Bacteroides sp.]|nr:hypothetical protein [Bacteroides sp.]
MNKDSLNLKDLPASIDSLETTAEGQLRGGFAVMGGGTASPMRANDQCINGGCSNNSCNGSHNEKNKGCHNNGCTSDSNNEACYNEGCSSGPSGNTDNSVPSLGITSLF